MITTPKRLQAFLKRLDRLAGRSAGRQPAPPTETTFFESMENRVLFSIDGVAELADFLGNAVAVGDFDGDGFDDVAIGVRGENIGGVANAGAVNVIYGSAGAGLADPGNQVWHQDSPGIVGAAEANDQFGYSLAAGDFDNDGFDDLAIGVATEDIGAINAAGAVNVIYGSAGVGLTAAGDQVWHQDSAGIVGAAESGDQFGFSLTAGDFDNDGFDDLAIGVPMEDIGAIPDAGAVNVIYGSAGVGLTAAGDQVWHQNSSGILGTAEAGDQFGYSLAAGDFDNDARDDLAIGVPTENINAINDAGAVNVIYGSAGVGLTAAGDQVWHQNSSGIIGTAETDDRLGFALAAGDFDNDGFDDLAIGAPFEAINAIADAGAVNVIYGSAGVGLTAAGDQVWHQNSSGIVGAAEAGDVFGYSLTAGDFDGDGFDDLAIGVPREDINAIPSAGAANVIYGSAGAGLTAAGDQVWHQDSSGIVGTAEAGDQFGYSLAAGDFDNDSRDDLAIGVIFEDIGNIDDAGAINAIYGSAGAGLADPGNQVWHQNS